LPAVAKFYIVYCDHGFLIHEQQRPKALIIGYGYVHVLKY